MPKRPTARRILGCEDTTQKSPNSECFHEVVKKSFSFWRHVPSQHLRWGAAFGFVLVLSACADTYNTYNTYYNEEYYSVPVAAPASVFDSPASVKNAAILAPKPFSKLSDAPSNAVEHMPEVVISTPLAPLKTAAKPTQNATTSQKAKVEVEGKNLSWRRKPLKLSQDFEANASEANQPKVQNLQANTDDKGGIFDTNQAALEKTPEAQTQIASIETRSTPEQATQKIKPDTLSSKASSPSKSDYSSYVVKKGDTSFGIASRHNMTIDALADLNTLGADYSVFVGQTLKVLKSETQETAIIAPTKVKKTQDNRRAALKKIKTPERSGDKLAWPIVGKVVERYGSKPDGRYVEGVRLSTAQGTPVRAAENGVVVYRDRLTNNLKSYGQVVIIKHSRDQATVYSGINNVVPEVGATVKRGDVIGKIGQSRELMFVVSDHKGKMTDPMLHLERRKS